MRCPIPIVIKNQPSQLIGDLSQNAGNFATQQAVQQQGLEQARFADSQRRGDEQMQMQRAEMQQRADIAKQHIQAQVMAHVLNSMSQQQLTALRDDARMKQIAAQGQNQQTLAGINGSNRASVNQANLSSREGMAANRDATQRRGQDLTSGYNYDRLDQGNDQFNARQDQQQGQYDQTYQQRDRGLDIRQQGTDNAQAWQQGRLNQYADRNTIVAQQQARLKMAQDLQSLQDEAHVLGGLIKSDPRGKRPETQQNRERLNVVGKEIQSLGFKIRNSDLSATGTPVQTPGQQDFGESMVMPPQSAQQPMQPPMQQPATQPMQQQPQVNPDVIRQLVLEGYTNEEIKAMIRGQ